jgi:hypothetical protein
VRAALECDAGVEDKMFTDGLDTSALQWVRKVGYGCGWVGGWTMQCARV